MSRLTQIQYVELFHLLFLAHAGPALDKRHYALKGGCNLRFFFGSIRYSEDVDFDVQAMSVDELRGRVNRILASKSFRQSLGLREIELEHVTESKRTETTQRWKFGLVTPAASLPAPTKIEFSRRNAIAEAVLENVAPALLRSCGLPPLLLSHYPAGAAWRQKVGALAHRTVTQARDIFDLHLLVAAGLVEPAREAASLPATLVQAAAQRCLGVRFDAFKGQVLSYLAADQQPAYDAPDVWDAMVLTVADSLRGGHENP